MKQPPTSSDSTPPRPAQPELPPLETRPPQDRLRATLSVPPPPPSEPDRRGHGVPWELTLALLVVAAVVAVGAALLAAELWLGDRVVPGVQVWDVDVGGLSRDEAIERVRTQFRYPADRNPVLRLGDQAWPVTPADLGLQLDLETTVDAAFAVGHSGDWVSRVKEQVGVLLNGRLVTPAFTSDPGLAAMLLTGIANQVNRPLHNASLRLQDDLSVEIVSGQAGRTVDEEATQQVLVERMVSMMGGAVPLVVRESEPLLTDVTAAEAQVQRILSGPITLTAPGFDPWTLESKTLAEWLILRPSSGPDGKLTLTVSLDTGQATRLAEQIAAQVARTPVDARFRWDDAAGGITLVGESTPGQALDVTGTVSLIEEAASGDQRTVPLPLVLIPPRIAADAAPDLGVVALIGEGVTSFAGSSAARVQNIAVGASQFDGLLIAPDETFSFNHYLGEITAEKGYVEGIIIWGDTTRADVGGGLCQVASTAFRAAFWAGVPIVERTPHAFRVGYYEPPVGLDATIYSPVVDLKWVNDTGHYVLIHTRVDRENQTLTFRFYGTKPDYTVELDGPYEANPVPHGPAVYRDDPTLPKGQKKQIEWPKDGLDVTVYRVIKADGVEVRRDKFFSRYRPWQAVYLVGTKE